MACSAILDMTSPSPSCQCLVAGKGTPPGPGACGQNTSGTPKVRLLPGHGRPRPGGSRPPASPGPAVRRQDTRSTVSSAQGQDQDQRQDAASLREGRCGSPEDNPVNNPVSEPSPTMVEEVFGAASLRVSRSAVAAPVGRFCVPAEPAGHRVRRDQRRGQFPGAVPASSACATRSVHRGLNLG